MYWDDGDSYTPDPWQAPGRQQDPDAPLGYTIPDTPYTPEPAGPEPGPTASGPEEPAPAPTSWNPTPSTPIPNPSDYPSAPLPVLRPPPPSFQAPDALAPWTGTFSAPTIDQASQEPGFQFQLGEGLKALERSAAAKGTLLTGGTQKGLVGYANDAANTNYQDVYNRAYNEYEGGRNNFLTNEANRYNSQVSNEKNRYDTEFSNWMGQFGQEGDLFGMADTNRMHDWGIGSDYFGMGQSQRMNDFNIWNTQDMNTFSKLLEWAKLRKPPSPYGSGY